MRSLSSRVILISFVLISSVVPSTGQNIMIGVLEDVPGVYTDEPTSRKVRAVFRKNGSDWAAFPHDCGGQGCVKSLSAEYPQVVTWTIAFDGRKIGQVTARTQKEFRFHSEVGLQEIIGAGPVPTVGKRSPEYAGFASDAAYRPLAVVSRPYFNDPELWKPSQLPVEVVTLLRQEFRKKYPKVENCANPEENVARPWHYSDKDIKISKSFCSNRRWCVARVFLAGYRCDGPSDDPFVDHWFVISSANDLISIGQTMWLVDAGDYDNDGKSEVLFSIAGYNRGGYALFYDDFTKHATFEFTYH